MRQRLSQAFNSAVSRAKGSPAAAAAAPPAYYFTPKPRRQRPTAQAQARRAKVRGTIREDGALDAISARVKSMAQGHSAAGENERAQILPIYGNKFTAVGHGNVEQLIDLERNYADNQLARLATLGFLHAGVGRPDKRSTNYCLAVADGGMTLDPRIGVEAAAKENHGIYVFIIGLLKVPHACLLIVDTQAPGGGMAWSAGFGYWGEDRPISARTGTIPITAFLQTIQQNDFLRERLRGLDPQFGTGHNIEDMLPGCLYTADYLISPHRRKGSGGGLQSHVLYVCHYTPAIARSLAADLAHAKLVFIDAYNDTRDRTFGRNSIVMMPHLTYSAWSPFHSPLGSNHTNCLTWTQSKLQSDFMRHQPIGGYLGQGGLNCGFPVIVPQWCKTLDADDLRFVMTYISANPSRRADGQEELLNELQKRLLKKTPASMLGKCCRVGAKCGGLTLLCGAAGAGAGATCGCAGAGMRVGAAVGAVGDAYRHGRTWGIVPPVQDMMRAATKVKQDGGGLRTNKRRARRGSRRRRRQGKRGGGRRTRRQRRRTRRQRRRTRRHRQRRRQRYR